MSSRSQNCKKEQCGATSVLIAPTDQRSPLRSLAYCPALTDDERSKRLSVSTGVVSPCRMAVTRGSAKRSSCCPSSSTVSGGSAQVPDGGVPSNTAGTVSADDANSLHQRGGGQRLSKRPALVDRTNSGSSSSAQGQSMLGHLALCPGDNQPSGPSQDVAAVAIASSVAQSVPGTEGEDRDALMQNSAVSVGQKTHSNFLPSSVGSLGSQPASFHGSAGNSSRNSGSQPRGLSRRSGGSLRGRTRGRGSSSVGNSAGSTRRRRSDGGSSGSARPGLAMPIDGTSSGVFPCSSSVECDRQPKGHAEKGVDDMEDEGQGLLLSDETLNISGEGLDTTTFPDLGFGSQSASRISNVNFDGDHPGGAMRDVGFEESDEGSRDDRSGSRLPGASLGGAAPTSCCRSYQEDSSSALGPGAVIQLLAVQEDLDSVPSSVSDSGPRMTGPALSLPLIAVEKETRPPCAESWGTGMMNGNGAAAGHPHSGKQEPIWGCGPGHVRLLAAPHQGTCGTNTVPGQGPFTQDRLQGSAVQASELAIASLQRHAERSLQISSIRQNKSGPGAAHEWALHSGEELACSQPVRSSEGDCTAAMPTLLGGAPSVHAGPQQHRQDAAQMMANGDQHQMMPHGFNQFAPNHRSQPRQDAVGAQHLQVMQPPLMYQQQSQHPFDNRQSLPHAQPQMSEFHNFSGHALSLPNMPQQPKPLCCEPAAVGDIPELPPQSGVSGSQHLSATQGMAEDVTAVHNRPNAGLMVKKSFTQHLDIDGNHADPQLCAAYAAEIFQHLRASELKRRPQQVYMEAVQTDINEQMRGILIDWLVEVAEEYKLVADTLYLTCSFIDRYLSTTSVTRARLQLLGVSCMLIASKYEEIYAPQVDEFCYITDNTYRREEVIEMERAVLKELHFELSYPTIKSFLRRFVRAAQADLPVPSIQLELLGNYFAELTLVDYKSLKFLPSVVAASAVFLAKRTLWPGSHPWTSTLRHYSNFSPQQMEECVRNLHNLHRNTKGCALPAIREKYRQAKFQHVATIPPCPELSASLFLDECC